MPPAATPLSDSLTAGQPAKLSEASALWVAGLVKGRKLLRAAIRRKDANAAASVLEELGPAWCQGSPQFTGECLMMAATKGAECGVLDVLVQHVPDWIAQDGNAVAEILECVSKLCQEDSTLDALHEVCEAAGRHWASLQGVSALHVAARSGHYAGVQRRLDRGEDVNATTHNHSTSLHFACCAGHIAVVQLLLERGADINMYDQGGHTALHAAAMTGQTAVVEMLLEFAAGARLKRIRRKTPQDIALAKSRAMLTAAKMLNGIDTGYSSVSSLSKLDTSMEFNEVKRSSALDTSDDDGAWAPSGKKMVTSAGSPMWNSVSSPHVHPDGEEVEEGDKKADMAVAIRQPVQDFQIDARDDIGRTALHWAARYGHVEVVRELLQHGASVDAGDDMGHSALHLAASGYPEVVQALIEFRARVNARDNSGGTPLHVAARYGQKVLAFMLIESGADINAMDEFGCSILFAAAMGGHTEMVKMLAGMGADFNAKDIYEGRAMHWAAGHGQVSVVKELRSHGQDVDSRDAYQQTPLHIASMDGHLGVVELLLELGADPYSRNISGRNALMLAAQHGHVDVVRCLAKKGLKVNDVDDAGETALHVACAEGMLDMVTALLELGANANLQDNKKRTSLFMAAQNGHEDVVQVLLAYGVDMNLGDHRERSPLCAAAIGGYEGVVECLGKAGADVQLRDVTGGSALFWAAGHGKASMVRLLSKLGARVQEVDKCGQTALHVAAASGNADVAEVLVDLGADMKAADNEGCLPIHIAAKLGSDAVLQTLADLGSSLTMRTKHGCTALHLAAMRGQTSTLELLLELGVPSSIRDYNGGTALHWAAGHGQCDALVLLLDAGADLDAMDSNNQTALHVAAAAGSAEAVLTLLGFGCRVNDGDAHGRTPLNWATRHNHHKVIKILERQTGETGDLSLLTKAQLQALSRSHATLRRYAAEAINGSKTGLASIAQGPKPFERPPLPAPEITPASPTADSANANPTPLHEANSSLPGDAVHGEGESSGKAAGKKLPEYRNDGGVEGAMREALRDSMSSTYSPGQRDDALMYSTAEDDVFQVTTSPKTSTMRAFEGPEQGPAPKQNKPFQKQDSGSSNHRPEDGPRSAAHPGSTFAPAHQELLEAEKQIQDKLSRGENISPEEYHTSSSPTAKAAAGSSIPQSRAPAFDSGRVSGRTTSSSVQTPPKFDNNFKQQFAAAMAVEMRLQESSGKYHGSLDEEDITGSQDGSSVLARAAKRLSTVEKQQTGAEEAEGKLRVNRNGRHVEDDSLSSARARLLYVDRGGGSEDSEAYGSAPMDVHQLGQNMAGMQEASSKVHSVRSAHDPRQQAYGAGMAHNLSHEEDAMAQAHGERGAVRSDKGVQHPVDGSTTSASPVSDDAAREAGGRHQHAADAVNEIISPRQEANMQDGGNGWSSFGLFKKSFRRKTRVSDGSTATADTTPAPTPREDTSKKVASAANADDQSQYAYQHHHPNTLPQVPEVPLVVDTSVGQFDAHTASPQVLSPVESNTEREPAIVTYRHPVRKRGKKSGKASRIDATDVLSPRDSPDFEPRCLSGLKNHAVRSASAKMLAARADDGRVTPESSGRLSPVSSGIQSPNGHTDAWHTEDDGIKSPIKGLAAKLSPENWARNRLKPKGAAAPLSPKPVSSGSEVSSSLASLRRTPVPDGVAVLPQDVLQSTQSMDMAVFVDPTMSMTGLVKRTTGQRPGGALAPSTRPPAQLTIVDSGEQGVFTMLRMSENARDDDVRSSNGSAALSRMPASIVNPLKASQEARSAVLDQAPVSTEDMMKYGGSHSESIPSTSEVPSMMMRQELAVHHMGSDVKYNPAPALANSRVINISEEVAGFTDSSPTAYPRNPNNMLPSNTLAASIPAVVPTRPAGAISPSPLSQSASGVIPNSQSASGVIQNSLSASGVIQNSLSASSVVPNSLSAGGAVQAARLGLTTASERTSARPQRIDTSLSAWDVACVPSQPTPEDSSEHASDITRASEPAMRPVQRAVSDSIDSHHAFMRTSSLPRGNTAGTKAVDEHMDDAHQPVYVGYQQAYEPAAVHAMQRSFDRGLGREWSGKDVTPSPRLVVRRESPKHPWDITPSPRDGVHYRELSPRGPTPGSRDDILYREVNPKDPVAPTSRDDILYREVDPRDVSRSPRLSPSPRDAAYAPARDPRPTPHSPSRDTRHRESPHSVVQEASRRMESARSPGRDASRRRESSRSPSREPVRHRESSRSPGRDATRQRETSRSPGRDAGRRESSRSPARDTRRRESSRSPGRDATRRREAPSMDTRSEREYRRREASRSPLRDAGRRESMRSPRDMPRSPRAAPASPRESMRSLVRASERELMKGKEVADTGPVPLETSPSEHETPTLTKKPQTLGDLIKDQELAPTPRKSSMKQQETADDKAKVAAQPVVAQPVAAPAKPAIQVPADLYAPLYGARNPSPPRGLRTIPGAPVSPKDGVNAGRVVVSTGPAPPRQVVSPQRTVRTIDSSKSPDGKPKAEDARRSTSRERERMDREKALRHREREKERERARKDREYEKEREARKMREREMGRDGRRYGDNDRERQLRDREIKERLARDKEARDRSATEREIWERERAKRREARAHKRMVEEDPGTARNPVPSERSHRDQQNGLRESRGRSEHRGASKSDMDSGSKSAKRRSVSRERSEQGRSPLRWPRRDRVFPDDSGTSDFPVEILPARSRQEGVRLTSSYGGSADEYEYQRSLAVGGR